MSGYFNFNEIENRLEKKKKTDGAGLSSHDTGEVKYAFPFVSSRLTKVFNNNINEIIGELVRITNNFKEPEFNYDGDFTYSDYHLINNVVGNVEFPGEHQDILAGFLEDFLFKNSSELKPLHLYLFNYIGLQEENKGEKEKYSRFIYDLLFYNNSNTSSLFSSKDTDNLLTELIITSLPELESRKASKQIKGTQYTNTIPSLNQLFVDDFLFLSNHNEYFINRFFQLVHYYIFQYVLQFLKKAQKFGEDENPEALEPFYFTFDWETGVGGYREAVESYGFIKNNAQNLFVHVHCLSHLSHNSSNANNELQSYTKVLEELQSLPEGEQHLEKDKLIEWINNYSKLIGKYPDDMGRDLEFHELFKILFTQLQKGMSDEVCSKYGKNIDNLGKNQFLKARGKHGFILSLKQDDFLMLSAVAVRDKKIPLKEFFKQLELRGVVFDQYSKKEAIKLLEQQNYIEKKSDSGDAQYVKPIL